MPTKSSIVPAPSGSRIELAAELAPNTPSPTRTSPRSEMAPATSGRRRENRVGGTTEPSRTAAIGGARGAPGGGAGAAGAGAGDPGGRGGPPPRRGRAGPGGGGGGPGGQRGHHRTRGQHGAGVREVDPEGHEQRVEAARQPEPEEKPDERGDQADDRALEHHGTQHLTPRGAERAQRGELARALRDGD